MIDIKTKVYTKTTITHSIELTGVDILSLLNQRGITVPDKATKLAVYFAVPGGANWSNCTFDIDAETPVRVMWETTEEQTS